MDTFEEMINEHYDVNSQYRWMDHGRMRGPFSIKFNTGYCQTLCAHVYRPCNAQCNGSPIQLYDESLNQVTMVCPFKNMDDTPTLEKIELTNSRW